VGPSGVVTSSTIGTLDYYAYNVPPISAIYFPTWSTVNGQDDLIWYRGIDQGGGTWKASINLTNHRPGNPDYGLIYVDVWYTTPVGTWTYCGGTTFTRVAPGRPSCTVTGPQGVVTNATSGWLDFYAYGVQNAKSVYFPTWSQVNGQDDIVWYRAVDQGNGTWKASVNLANHRPGNPDYGLIYVDIWMFGTENVYCGGAIITRTQ
jgi:hypothetical protein